MGCILEVKLIGYIDRLDVGWEGNGRIKDGFLVSSGMERGLFIEMERV